ncbi:c-type cytochrome [Pseudomonas sp. TWR3-1-1]|uniref:c-type cytochrome n=1 Tax=Pseudomonas sp. TWR3-1-1 TaxID=2804633 RepID=UPI003CEB2983
MNLSAFTTLALTITLGIFSAAAAAAGDADAGAKLFTKTCGGCHSIGPGARGGFGPQLNGVIGRTAGITPGYQYSDAMKNSGVVWSRETLAAYIEAPKKVVSGTRMIFWGISDPQKIDDLLAYIATFQDTDH